MAENIEGKGENNADRHLFFFFISCFQKAPLITDRINLSIFNGNVCVKKKCGRNQNEQGLIDGNMF